MKRTLVWAGLAVGLLLVIGGLVWEITTLKIPGFPGLVAVILIVVELGHSDLGKLVGLSDRERS